MIYKFVNLHTEILAVEDMEAWMNARAREGWRLVSFSKNGTHHLVILERATPPTKGPR